ncbi:MAG: hypothetical protein SW127_21410, partial [Actinomycetota bacterium]|nr:hypothetical protein [Actinomycetota bacterium]
GEFAAEQRPHLIHLVDEIPVSDAYRPVAAGFANRGLPRPGSKVWYRDSEGRYRRYTRSAAATMGWSMESGAGGNAPAAGSR